MKKYVCETAASAAEAPALSARQEERDESVVAEVREDSSFLRESFFGLFEPSLRLLSSLSSLGF